MKESILVFTFRLCLESGFGFCRLFVLFLFGFGELGLREVKIFVCKREC